MKDPKTENFLIGGRWQHRYDAAVPLASIDLDASFANEGRLGKRLEEDRVLEYALAKDAGDEFPAVVLLDVAGHLSVATGTHRLHADKCMKRVPKTVDAYIVTESDLYRREVLCRQLNMIEGRGQTHAEKVAHALELHRKFPSHSLKSLAQEWRLNVSTLQAAAREQALDSRAITLGLIGFPQLSQTLKMKFGQIDNDACFIGAVSLALEARLRGSEAAEFADRVAQAATRKEATGLAVIEEMRREIAETNERNKAKFGRTPTSKATRFIGKCKELNRMVPDGLVSNLHLGCLARIPEQKRLVQETIDLLHLVIEELDRVAGAQAA